MEGFDAGWLQGPIGGIVAIAYAAGACSGYLFCIRTMYQLIKAQATKDESYWHKRVTTLEGELRDAKNQVNVLNDRLLHGMERQGAQVRQSSVEVLGHLRKSYEEDE